MLLVLAASAAFAAPAPLPAFLAAPGAGSPALAVLFGQPPATPADVGPCGIPTYFCQDCQTPTPERRLCSTKVCGTVVIVSCGDCSPRCILPPG